LIYYKRCIIVTKIDKTLEKINNQLRHIFEENPDFTGNITMDFCLGGLTGFKKIEIVIYK